MNTARTIFVYLVCVVAAVGLIATVAAFVRWGS